MSGGFERQAESPVPARRAVPLRGSLAAIVAEVEAKVIRQALIDCDGNLTQAAATLQISRTTHRSKMRQAGSRVRDRI